MKKIIFFVILMIWPRVGHSLVYIDINTPGQQKIPIAISSFVIKGDKQIALEAQSILEQDLKYTGFFNILSPEIFLENTPTLEIDFKKWQLIGAYLVVKAKLEIAPQVINLEMRLYDASQGIMLVGKRYQGKKNALRFMVHKFADAMMEALSGEPSIFQTKIAFVYKYNNTKEIFVTDFDGYNPHPLTKFKTICLSPKWHPNEKKLLFTSYKKGKPEIYLLDLAKGEAKRLICHSNLNITPAWSPDGNRIAVTLARGKKQGIYLTDKHGKIIKCLVQSEGINVSPTWSPDGKKIAFVSDRGGTPQIYTLNLVSNKIRRISFSGSYNTSPAWSPKGDFIAYAGLKDGHFQIFVVSMDSGEIKQLTFDETNHESPSWSPDGHFLAYSQNEKIYILRLTDGSSFPILSLPEGQLQPSWSPRLK